MWYVHFGQTVHKAIHPQTIYIVIDEPGDDLDPARIIVPKRILPVPPEESDIERVAAQCSCVTC